MNDSCPHCRARLRWRLLRWHPAYGLWQGCAPSSVLACPRCGGAIRANSDDGGSRWGAIYPPLYVTMICWVAAGQYPAYSTLFTAIALVVVAAALGIVILRKPSQPRGGGTRYVAVPERRSSADSTVAAHP